MKFGGVLDRQAARFFALENSIDIGCCSAEQFSCINPVGCERTGLYILAEWINRWQAVALGELADHGSMGRYQRTGRYDQAALWLARKRFDAVLEVFSGASLYCRYAYAKRGRGCFNGMQISNS